MSDFSNIWLPFAERFYKVAFYLLESGSEAEDAVQELYLKLWSARSSLDEVRNPFAYGVSLLKNICIDRVRKRRVRNAEPLEKAPPLAEPSAHRQAEIKDTLKFLLKEMEKLLPECEIFWDGEPTWGGWREHHRYDTIYAIFNEGGYRPFNETK